ncbi:reductive dehalogenase [candidate division KSB1 bacterium]|nr:reductive dehalogenase [candidate division KSB1 bacterium]
MPLGTNTPVQIIGEKTRYDERDIMFARAHYTPGSDAYDDYYERHPDKAKIDREIRAMPELMQSGGRHYEPTDAARARANFNLTEQLTLFCNGQPALQKAAAEPDEIGLELKKMAILSGAVDARIAALDHQHLYSHIGRRLAEYGTAIELAHTHALVYAVEMDYTAMQHAPYMPVMVESSKQYLKAAAIGVALASHIRLLGYNARVHMDGNYLMPLPAIASDAGLGEVGRIGYLIHPRYGARIRLGAVTTDMPLATDSSILFGVQDFCRICLKCATHCPAGAISFSEEKEVRGVRKWSTNQEACYRYWRTIGTDCGICLRVCPFSKPTNMAHSVIRMFIRRNAISRQIAVWGDKLLYD